MITSSSPDRLVAPAAVPVCTGAEPPASRWPLPLQVLVCPVLLAGAVFAPALLALLPGLSRLDSPETPVGVGVVVLVGLHLITLLLAVALVAVVARSDGRRRLADLGVRWDRRSLPGLGLGLGVSTAVLLGVGIPLTAAGHLRALESPAAGLPIWATVVVGLSLAFVLQGIPEELIFRGYLLRSLRTRPVTAVLISGVAFGLLHLASSGGQQNWTERLAYLAMPTGFGLAAGALALVTGSWWAAVGIHGGFHLAYLGAALAGGDTVAVGSGPTLWLLAGAAYVVVAVVALVLHRRRSAVQPVPQQAQVAG